MIIDFLMTHWIAITLGLIVPVASIIAKATRTKTDDKILFVLLKFIDLIAMNSKPTKFTGQKQSITQNYKGNQ